MEDCLRSFQIRNKKTPGIICCTLICALIFLTFLQTGFVLASENGTEDSEPENVLLSFGYDPDNDSIWFVTSEPAAQVWCANVKKEAGTSLKRRSFVTKHSSSEYSERKSGYVGRFSLCDSEYGFDISPAKTACMYITAERPDKTKTQYSPNIIIDASPYRKLEVVLDYAAAYEGSERCAVKSLSLTEKGGSSVEYSVAMNKTEFDSRLQELLYGIYDEDRYLDLNGAVCEEDDTEPVYDELLKQMRAVTEYCFDGDFLNDLIVNNSDPDADYVYKLGFRYRGSAATGGKNAIRTGSPVTVLIKNAPVQVYAKFDTSTDSLSIGNGYDFMVITDRESAYRSGIWYTVLPYNRKGISQDAVIPTEMYSAGKTFTGNADMYTSVRISAIPLYMLTGSSDCRILVRKSATYSAPAGLIDGENGRTCELTLLKRTVAPVVQKDYNTGFLAIADEKGTMTIPVINAAYADTSKGSKFEYVIIGAADYEKELTTPGSIDMNSLKWLKYTAGKTLTIGRSKSSYRMKDALKASDHILGDGDYILIRRCGVKNKKDPYSPFVASEPLVTRIGKKTVFGVEKEVWYQID